MNEYIYTVHIVLFNVNGRKVIKGESNMKIGINLLLWTASPNFAQHERLLEELKEWGFDAFEIGVSGLDTQEIDKFAKKAQALQLEPSTLDVYIASDFDMISPDPVSRRKAIDFTKSNISKTVDIGAKVYSGPMWQGLCNSTNVGPSEDEWKWAVEGMRECALYAQEKGVRLAAEPINRFEMYLLNSVEKAYELCVETGVKAAGILADTHHSNIEEYDTAAAWAKVMERIHSVHISENNRGIPGMGHAIPPSVFETLKNGGYSGNLIIEAFNANVPETLPLLRLWRPFVADESEIAKKGLAYIKQFV